MSLDEENLRKRAFESELKALYDMKRPNGMNFIHYKKVKKNSRIQFTT